MFNNVEVYYFDLSLSNICRGASRLMTNFNFNLICKNSSTVSSCLAVAFIVQITLLLGEFCARGPY